MIASILIPSRGRAKYLPLAIQSYMYMAKKPHEVEIIIRLHHDDHESVEMAPLLRKLGASIIIGDTDGGYSALGKFVNCMAAVSRGKWLIPAADDLRMDVSGWDSELEALDYTQPMFVKVKLLPSGEIGFYSRRLYEILGTAGETEHPDSYMDALAGLAGIKQESRIAMFNINPPPVAPRDALASWARYRTPESAARFNLDKAKLEAFLKRSLGNWTTTDAPINPWSKR